MKKLAIILALIFGISLMHSCEKEEETVLNLGDAVAPVLTYPEDGSSYTLTEEEEDEVLFTFEWTAADYKKEGLPEVRYLIQADKSVRNWQVSDSIRDIAETRETSHEISVGRMNTILSRVGLEPFEEEEVSFRVIAFLTRASDHAWLHSETVGSNITTFEAITEPDTLNVPGSYQGWDPENNRTVVYSPDRDDLFEGYFYFEEDDTEYKFARGSWDENWGDDGADGTLDPDGENIVAPEAGVYRINADLNEMSHEFYRTEWALIGDAAEGWDTDVPMELDLQYWEDEWKVRYTITLELQEGHFKFRANQAWDPPAGLNMGIDEDAEEEGVLMYGGFGNDIPVEQAGEYTVILDLTGPVYRYELIKE